MDENCASRLNSIFNETTGRWKVLADVFPWDVHDADDFVVDFLRK